VRRACGRGRIRGGMPTTTPEHEAFWSTDETSYVVRVFLPNVQSAACVSVTIVAGQCVEVVADDGNGEKFELTHSLPFPLRSDRTARAIKFSKKTGRLTLEFQKLPTGYTHTGSNASNTSGDDTPKKEKQTNAAPEAPGAFVVPNSFPNAAESLVYVFSDLRRGRGLRARRSLTAGSIVFVTPPITCTTHDTRKDDLCGFCFHELCLSSSSSSSTRTCEECFTAYCSKTCEEKDVAHFGECALVKRAGGDKKLSQATRGARMFLRLLYLRAMVPDLFAETEIWRASDEKYDASVSGACAFLNAVLPASALVQFDLENFVKKTRENLHGIVANDGTQLGTGAYGLASLLNHDCAPNCVTSFKVGGVRDDDEKGGPCLVLRTVREVEMHDELTVGYVELYASTGERRARLLKSKGFRCACARCESTSKNANAEKTLTGWRCADSLCVGVAAHDAFATTEDESPLEDLLICSTCLSGTAVGGVSKRDATGAETRWRTAIDKSREFGRNGDHAESSKIASDTLAECANSLHKDHVVQHELRLALTAASVKLGDWRVVANTARATVVSMAKGSCFLLNGSHPGLADARNTLADALERIYGDEGDTQGDKSDLLEEALVNRTAMCEALRVAYGDEHDATKKAVAKRDVLEGKRRTEK